MERQEHKWKKATDRVIGRFKVHRTGELFSLTVPDDVAINEDDEFLLLISTDGTLKYISKHINLWHTNDIKIRHFKELKKRLVWQLKDFSKTRKYD